MKRQDHIKLEALSQLDDEVVTRNIQKRHLLLRGVKSKKRVTRTVIAIAACLAILLSMMAVFLIPSLTKQVPIYQGMTVSNEAPVAQMANNHGASLRVSPPLFGAIGMRFGTSSIPGTSTTPNTDKYVPEISGGPYYAQPNEDIYIHVHISNPDGFEILSFTLNGVKYSSYMFESGSDLETLILKYNVGEEEGVQQYTIDAIKYVDGEDIKDVRMEGERTIEVLVGNDAQDLTFTTQFDGWDVVITPKWAEAFAGEKKILSLAVYEGETLLRELDPDATVIKDLPMDKRLLLVATYLDNDKTVTTQSVIQTPKQSEGLLIVNGVVSGFGTCTDTELYINMPIADEAFNDNKQITKVYLGSSVTTIGSEAFSGCTKLTDIVIQSTVTSMGHGVFADCISLKNVILENTPTSIPDSLFSNCTSLTSFTIPDSVTRIGTSAFEGCISLTSITIPDSVTSIGLGAFNNCTSLTSMTLPFVGATKNGDTNTHLGYIFGVSRVDDMPYSSCFPSSLTTVVVTSDCIRENAFYYCTSLTSITIPDSVTSIGEYAFSGCSNLTTITLPAAVTSIGDGAFYCCTSLANITIPDSVTTIGNVVFSRCTSLTSITIPDSVTSIGNYAFFACTNLTDITIPDSVTSIGEQAFAECSKLTSITIPDRVMNIGFSAFNGCTSLTSMTLPFVGATISGNSNTHFGYLFGAGNYGDNSSSVPSTLTTVVVMGGDIPKYAFYGCSSLTSITIPDSVTSIGDAAFYGCNSLANITIPDSVTSIGKEAFRFCGLTSITIPDSVTSIGDAAFVGCTSLANITIPDSVTSIGWNTFVECYSLTNITIPDSVTSIGVSAFAQCTSLTNISIPDSVTSIGTGAFEGCNFTSITIPDSVTSIADSAFWNCTSLTNITIPDSVTSIGESAFYGCSKFTTVNYAGTKEQWSAVEKTRNWRHPSVKVTVHCSDGDVIE